MLSVSIHNNLTERNATSSSQQIQTEQILERSRLELPIAKPDNNVAVPISLTDRGHDDP